MSDKFKHIISDVLATAAEDFPAEPGDMDAWHFTSDQIRSLLAGVAERVEEAMLDAAEVGKHMGQLSIERNHAQAERDHARGLIAKVLQDLPEAGKDNDAVYSVWHTLYKQAHWLHPAMDGNRG